ncbi:MAG: hypothetical protein ACE364_12580 [Chlorobiota bacterium]
MNITEVEIFRFLTEINIKGTFEANTYQEKSFITTRFDLFKRDESKPIKNEKGGYLFKNVSLTQEGKEFIIRKAFSSIQNNC